MEPFVRFQLNVHMMEMLVHNMFKTILTSLILLVGLSASADIHLDKRRASPNLQDVQIPTACDVFVTPATIGGVNFDDSETSVYCFEPGDYKSHGIIELKSSGTADNRRWILYHDPNSSQLGWQLLDSRRVHPYKLADADRVKIAQIKFFGDDTNYSSYWVVTGITFESEPVDGTKDSTAVLVQGDDNIFDYNDVFNNLADIDNKAPALIDIGDRNVSWQPANDGPARNYIQRNTVHNNMKLEAGDALGIRISGEDISTVDYPDNRILDNDIWDNGDGIQGTCCGGSSTIEPGTVSGLLIESNHLWMSGKWDAPCDFVSGEGMGRLGSGKGNECSCSENAIDMKIGGTINNPAIVRNNVAFHFQATTTAGGGDSCGGSGNVPGGAWANDPIGHGYTLWVRNIAWETGSCFKGVDTSANIDFIFNTCAELATVVGDGPVEVVQYLVDKGRFHGNLVSGGNNYLNNGETTEGGRLGTQEWSAGGYDTADIRCNKFVLDTNFKASKVSGPSIWSNYNTVIADDLQTAVSGTNVLNTDAVDDVNSVATLGKTNHNLEDLCITYRRWAPGVTDCIEDAYDPVPLCTGNEITDGGEDFLGTSMTNPYPDYKTWPRQQMWGIGTPGNAGTVTWWLGLQGGFCSGGSTVNECGFPIPTTGSFMNLGLWTRDVFPAGNTSTITLWYCPDDGNDQIDVAGCIDADTNWVESTLTCTIQVGSDNCVSDPEFAVTPAASNGNRVQVGRGYMVALEQEHSGASNRFMPSPYLEWMPSRNPDEFLFIGGGEMSNTTAVDRAHGVMGDLELSNTSRSSQPLVYETEISNCIMVRNEAELVGDDEINYKLVEGYARNDTTISGLIEPGTRAVYSSTTETFDEGTLLSWLPVPSDSPPEAMLRASCIAKPVKTRDENRWQMLAATADTHPLGGTTEYFSPPNHALQAVRTSTDIIIPYSFTLHDMACGIDDDPAPGSFEFDVEFDGTGQLVTTCSVDTADEVEILKDLEHTLNDGERFNGTVTDAGTPGTGANDFSFSVSGTRQ